MPRSFSDKEKEWIRNKLIETGQKLFEKYGIQKTSIDEIVKNVGISKGSFYSFFSSKEVLFFVIIEKIEKDFKEKLFNVDFENSIDVKETLRDLLTKNFEFIENNPLLKFISSKEFEYLIRKIPEDLIKEHMEKDINQFKEFIIKNQNKGVFAKRDLKGLMGFFKIIPYFVLSKKEEFDEDEYSATKKVIIEMIVNYLIP